MPKHKQQGRGPKRLWTTSDLKTLHRASEQRTAMKTLSSILKRTPGAIRQRARKEGLGIGQFQRGVATYKKRTGARRRLGFKYTFRAAA